MRTRSLPNSGRSGCQLPVLVLSLPAHGACSLFCPCIPGICPSSSALPFCFYRHRGVFLRYEQVLSVLSQELSCTLDRKRNFGKSAGKVANSPSGKGGLNQPQAPNATLKQGDPEPPPPLQSCCVRNNPLYPTPELRDLAPKCTGSG